MRKRLDYIGMLLSWFAVITQLVLMLTNREASLSETVIRFFSFFTILTNSLVASYFTFRVIQKSSEQVKPIPLNGAITAITTFIFIVGIVYQIALRHLWSPQGLQFIVDEMLHSVIPVFMLIYWVLYSQKFDFHLEYVIKWLAYPIIYAVFIIGRGALSEWYPYPFLNVVEIGYPKFFLNLSLIFGFSLIVMFSLTFIGKELLMKYRK